MHSAQDLQISSLLDSVRSVVERGLPVYLVGGAVRDILLEREVHDLDFALPAYAMESARAVANHLKAAYYPLDPVRQTGRVILTGENGQRRFLDFAVYRAEDLDGDLRGRDFTINAIAMQLDPSHNLVDPLNGVQDLRSKRLRACGPSSFADDPVRILRAARFATELDFRIQPATLESLRQTIPYLVQATPERARDELFRILEGSKPATCMRLLEMIGALPYLLPELVQLKNVDQSPPHIADVWTHTLDVMQKLETLLNILSERYEPDTAANLLAGQVSLRLGRYRQQIYDHLSQEPGVGRSVRGLLFFAALYHDAGKLLTRQVEESGRVRFFNHEIVGAEQVAARGQALRLSNVEVDRIEKLVRNHMRPILLANSEKMPSSRAIYRFFRDAGVAGVDASLLSLADVWGTYGPTLPQDVWSRQVEVVRLFLEAWWEKNEQVVSPSPLLNGYEIMSSLELSPGPLVGKLLEEIREAQVAGVVTDRQQALDYARSILKRDEAH